MADFLQTCQGKIWLFFLTFYRFWFCQPLPTLIFQNAVDDRITNLEFYRLAGFPRPEANQQNKAVSENYFETFLRHLWTAKILAIWRNIYKVKRFQLTAHHCIHDWEGGFFWGGGNVWCTSNTDTLENGGNDNDPNPEQNRTTKNSNLCSRYLCPDRHSAWSSLVCDCTASTWNIACDIPARGWRGSTARW